jgi:hypothetical protein
MAKRRKRSPLKGLPLRYPGQSVDERRAEVLERLELPALVALMLVAVTIIETFQAYTGRSAPLWMYFVGAAGAIVYAVANFVLSIPTLKALQLARDGERVVGQYLDALCEQGYRVFHDVVGTGFNVDHILVGPGGIYTVETKTWSKPVGEGAKVWFNGDELRVDGTESDRNPVIQAKAQAKWVRELLGESTGKSFAVRPVIVFPCWFVEKTPGAYKEMLVLNPKALPEFLKNQPACLSQEDVKLASFHLSRFIRGGA